MRKTRPMPSHCGSVAQAPLRNRYEKSTQTEEAENTFQKGPDGKYFICFRPHGLYLKSVVQNSHRQLWKCAAGL